MAAIGESGEAIVINAVAQAGIGPELLGVFDGGRLEAFVPSRTLHWKELRDKKVLAAAAQNLARFHSLQVPLKRDPKVFVEVVTGFVKSAMHSNRIKIDMAKQTRATQLKLNSLLSVNYFEKLTRVFAMAAEMNSRVVLTHGDHHSNNVLVPLDVNERDTLTAFDMSIIDMEMAAYCYRGLDIGCFLEEASFDYGDTSCPQFVGQLDDQLQRYFVREYLEQWKVLNLDKFNALVDNEEHIMKEQKLLALVCPYYFTNFILCSVAQDGSLGKSPLIDYLMLRKPMLEERLCSFQ